MSDKKSIKKVNSFKADELEKKIAEYSAKHTNSKYFSHMLARREEIKNK